MNQIQTSINIPQLIDTNKISQQQIIIVLLCTVCLILDGFDVQAMGYVAPSIIHEWGIQKSYLGQVFAAGLFGMQVGALFFSCLADRLGRRPVLIGATFFFAICMLLTPMMDSLNQLLIMRFITGVGLGAIMPNAMALSGEYSPASKRVTLMMLVPCGFTLGAVIGGLVAAGIIPYFGWQSVFYVGGLLPLMIAFLMLFWLPESLQFLVLNNVDKLSIRRIVQRLYPTYIISDQTSFLVNEIKNSEIPVIQLFKDGRAGGTIILWIINFMNLLTLYFLSNWLPTIVKEAGLSLSAAISAGTILQLGGTVGTLVMGQLIDRVGFKVVLIPVFIIGAIAIVLVGHLTTNLYFLSSCIFISGFCVIGGQPAISALAGSYYPTSFRASGIGCSLGIGRTGSVLGLIAGGVIMGLDLGNTFIFCLLAIPTLISALMLILMRYQD